MKAKAEHRGYTPRRRVVEPDYYGDYTGDDSADAYTGDYVVTKRAVDSTPARTAADSAAVFASAGLIDEEPPEDAGFWSQYQ